MKNKFEMIVESAISKAEITSAVSGLADKLQKMMSSLSDMKIDTLSKIGDRIRGEFSQEEAKKFFDEVGGSLDEAITALRAARENVLDKSLYLSGDKSNDATEDFKEFSEKEVEEEPTGTEEEPENLDLDFEEVTREEK